MTRRAAAQGSDTYSCLGRRRLAASSSSWAEVQQKYSRGTAYAGHAVHTFSVGRLHSLARPCHVRMPQGQLSIWPAVCPLPLQSCQPPSCSLQIASTSRPPRPCPAPALLTSGRLVAPISSSRAPLLLGSHPSIWINSSVLRRLLDSCSPSDLRADSSESISSRKMTDGCNRAVAHQQQDGNRRDHQEGEVGYVAAAAAFASSQRPCWRRQTVGSK